LYCRPAFGALAKIRQFFRLSPISKKICLISAVTRLDCNSKNRLLYHLQSSILFVKTAFGLTVNAKPVSAVKTAFGLRLEMRLSHHFSKNNTFCNVFGANYATVRISGKTPVRMMFSLLKARLCISHFESVSP
jgi:hypothetical protein